jgi:hypothetical protein
MAMSLTEMLNIAIFLVFMGVSVIPFYVTAKLGATTLGLASFVLGVFAVTHGFYHLLFAAGMYDLSLGFFGPVSAAFLLVFAAFLYRRGN